MIVYQNHAAANLHRHKHLLVKSCLCKFKYALTWFCLKIMPVQIWICTGMILTYCKTTDLLKLQPCNVRPKRRYSHMFPMQPHTKREISSNIPATYCYTRNILKFVPDNLLQNKRSPKTSPLQPDTKQRYPQAPPLQHSTKHRISSNYPHATD